MSAKKTLQIRWNFEGKVTLSEGGELGASYRKRVLVSVNEIRSILEAHYPDFTFIYIDFRFQVTETDRVLFISVHSYKMLPKKQVKQPHTLRPSLLCKRKSTTSKLDKQIDIMISKHRIPSMKHLYYSKRAPYIHSTDKCDPLDLHFAEKIAQQSEHMKARSAKSVEDLGKLVKTLRDSLSRNISKDNEMVDKAMKLLIIQKCWKKSPIKRDRFTTMLIQNSEAPPKRKTGIPNYVEKTALRLRSCKASTIHR